MSEATTFGPKPGFRTDIEGLRALAVAGVIAFHFGLTQIPGGFAGVDVFFVISGYLITGHLQSQLTKTGRISLASFYAGRLRRLLPSALLVVLATLVAGYFFYSPTEQKLYSSDAFFTSAYLLNVKLLKNSFDYFGPEAAGNPYLHFWSLAVEEQFYLFWPILLLAHFKFMRNIPLWVLVSAIVVLSFVGCAVVTIVSQPWAFYALPFRAWEFAIGGAIAFFPRSPSVMLKKAIGYIGLAVILVAYLCLSEEVGFPGWIALIPVLGAAAVIYAGIDPKSAVSILNLRPLQFTGWLSYPLYLWHWPVIVYASSLPFELTLIDRFGLVLLTVLLSLASKFLVENSVRYNRILTAKPSLAIGIALIATIGGMVSARSAGHIADLNLDGLQMNIASAAAKNSPAVDIGPACLASLMTEEPKICVLGDKTSNKTIVLIGDSHADAWLGGLDKLSKESHYKLITLMKSSCSFAEIKVYSFRLHREFTECYHWRDKAIALALKLKPDLVVLAQFTSSYVENSITQANYARASAEDFAQGIRRTVGTFSSSGIKVAVLKDVPFMRRSVPVCLSRADWLGRDANVCNVQRNLAFDPAVESAERKAVLQMAKAKYIDLTESYCNVTRCFAEKDGVPMYRDAHHITYIYSKSLAGKLKAAIN